MTKINLEQIDGLIDPANPPVDPATDAGKIVILDDNGKIGNDLLADIENIDASFIVQPSTFVKTSSLDAVDIQDNAGWSKAKEFVYNDISGTIRVYFSLTSLRYDYTTAGRIYKNGVAYGTQRSNKEVGVEYSEDLAFATGDLIQIYGYSSGNTHCRISGFKIAYDKVVKTKTNTVNQ